MLVFGASTAVSLPRGRPLRSCASPFVVVSADAGIVVPVVEKPAVVDVVELVLVVVALVDVVSFEAELRCVVMITVVADDIRCARLPCTR